MEEYQIDVPVQHEPYISNESASLLLTISMWTKFLSILGFILIGIMCLLLLLSGTLISGMNSYAAYSNMYPYVPGEFSWAFAAVYLIMLAVYFVPILFLYKFSTKVKKAVDNNSTRILTQSLRFLKSHYMIIGIIAIAAMIIFLISFITLLFGVGSMF